MAEQLLSMLESNLSYLSGVEQRIARVLLEDPQRFTTFSMSDLAAEADVSQGSIINFSKKFSGGGFPNLKLKIAECLASHEQKPFSLVDPGEGVIDAFQKAMAGQMRAYQNTAALNDPAVLQRVAEQILSAKKVEIYGTFRSAVVATDFFYQLLQLGIPAMFIDDYWTRRVSAHMVDSESLIFAISASGKTKEVLHTVSIAQENGATVVCLTNNRNSPLAEMADDVLIAAASGNSVGGRASEVYFSQLMVTEALCAHIRSRLDDSGQMRFLRLSGTLGLQDIHDA